MKELLVVTEAPGGSPLARAAADGVTPQGWYAPRPSGRAEWRAWATRTARRPDVARWHETLRPALAPSGAAAARLERSADGRGVVVTTGQQPGLFGGPLYTWNKALSALALADAIEEETGVPAAPVFWAATDDSDFAEASTTYVGVPGGVERLTLPEPTKLGSSLRDVPLGNIGHLIEALARGAGAAVYSEALEAVRQAYREGETVGGAYLSLLRSVLEPLGVAVLDAAHPAVRRAAAPVLHQALARAPEIERALAQREGEIVAAGFAPQVSLVPGLALVFDSLDGARRRIPVVDAAAIASGDADAVLSPNVLLRPLVESAILPTVAYVAGPGELAYFAQVSAVADALGRPTPVAMPRWSGTIVEPHVRRILERYELERDDLREPHAAEGRLAARKLNAGVRDALERSRDRIADIVRDLTDALEGTPPLVEERVIRGAAYGLEHRLDRLSRRVTAAVKRREEAMVKDLATARGALYPVGVPQERALNLIPLLARHGPRLLELMRARAAEHASGLVGAGDVSRTAASTPA